MNQQSDPFTNWSVRQAVVHAINYDRIIQVAFGGYAERWVGPVPPGYPYYNPDALAPYAYNLTVAKQYMAQSPWPNGYPNTINYEYVNLGDWADVANLLKDDLSRSDHDQSRRIANIDKLYELQKTDANGDCIARHRERRAFPIGRSSIHRTTSRRTTGRRTMCLPAEVQTAAWPGTATEHRQPHLGCRDPRATRSFAQSEYATITRTMYDNATVAWLVVPTQFKS